MAIAYRAGATARSTTGAPTMTIPATVQVGDQMLLSVVWKLAQSSGTIATPVGWKLLSAGVVDGQGASFQGAVFKRTAQAGDPGASFTVNPGGASQQCDAVLEAWSGASAILRDSGYAAKGTTAATTATATGETTGSGDWVVLVGMARGASNGPAGSPSFTAPSGFTVRHQSTAQSGAAQNVGTVIMDGTATGDQTLTASQTSWWICGQVILQETTAVEPPLLVAKYDGGWSTNTTPKSVSVTVAASDWVVVTGISADIAAPLATPTGGGLTYTLHQSVQTASRCATYLWSAQSGSAQTFTLQVTRSGSAFLWGFDVKVFRGAAGIGNGSAATATNGVPSTSLSASANSVIVWGSGDWVPVSGSTRGYLAIDGAVSSEHSYVFQSSWYTIYTGYYAGTDTAGSKTAGLTTPGGQTYSIAALEVLAPSAAGIDRSSSDAAAAADTVARSVALPRAVAESAAVVETTSGVTARARGTANAVATGEAVTAVITRVRTVTDATAVLDTADRVLLLVRAPAESVAAADAVTREGTTWGRPVAETVAAADTVARALLRTRDTADALAAADTAAATSAPARGVADSTTVVDAAARLAQLGGAVPESVNLTDDTAGSVGISAAGADAVTLAEVAARVLAGVAGGADTVSLADTASRAVAGGQATGDNISLADEVVGVSGQVVFLDDAVTTGDGSSSTSVHSRGPSDAVVVLDATTAVRLLAAAIGDAVTVADGVTGGRVVSVAPADAVAVLDAVTRTWAVQRTPIEAVSAGEVTVRVLAGGRLTDDTLTLLDAGVGVRGVTATPSDTLTLLDTAIRGVGQARTITDLITLFDAADGDLTLPPIIVIAAPHRITQTGSVARVSATPTAATQGRVTATVTPGGVRRTA